MPQWARLVSLNTEWYKNIDLDGEEVVFGRAPDCVTFSDWELDGSISGYHCRFYLWEEDGEKQVWLEDTSSNGTFVNGDLVGRGDSKQLLGGETITFVVPSVDHEQFSEETVAWEYKVVKQAPAPKKKAAVQQAPPAKQSAPAAAAPAPAPAAAAPAPAPAAAAPAAASKPHWDGFGGGDPNRDPNSSHPVGQPEVRSITAAHPAHDAKDAELRAFLKELGMDALTSRFLEAGIDFDELCNIPKRELMNRTGINNINGNVIMKNRPGGVNGRDGKAGAKKWAPAPGKFKAGFQGKAAPKKVAPKKVAPVAGAGADACPLCGKAIGAGEEKLVIAGTDHHARCYRAKTEGEHAAAVEAARPGAEVCPICSGEIGRGDETLIVAGTTHHAACYRKREFGDDDDDAAATPAAAASANTQQFDFMGRPICPQCSKPISHCDDTKTHDGLTIHEWCAPAAPPPAVRKEPAAKKPAAKKAAAPAAAPAALPKDDGTTKGFLLSLGLDGLVELFASEEIEYELLSVMTEDDLKDIGVTGADADKIVANRPAA